MKKVIILIGFLVVFNGFSQVDSSKTEKVLYTHTNLLKLNLFVPGAEFEYGVSQNRSLALSTGYWHIYSTNNYTSDIETLYRGFLPVLSYRNYYNIEKRQKKGKRAENFNANYIAIQGFYKPKYKKYDQRLGWGASWGVQRNYGKLFHLGFELGLGYGPNGFYLEDKNELFPHADLQLGFMFR